MFSLDALSFFAQPPGDIIYFLLVILLLQANLLFVNGFSFNSVDVPPMRGYIWGILLIVAFWLIYVAASFIAIASPLDARLLLPPIERGAILGSLGVFTWLFTSKDSTRSGFGVPLIAYVVLVALGIGASIALWNSEYTAIEFNQSAYHQYFLIAGLIVSLGGIAIIAMRSRDTTDTPLKIALMGIIAVGFGLSLVETMGAVSGDEPGILRLAYVIALAVAPYIVYRLSQYRIQEAVVKKLSSWQGTPRVVPPLTDEDERIRTSPTNSQSMQLLRALGRILEDSNPESLPRQIVLTALETCHGDVAALLRLQDVNYADLTDGYDRSQKRKIAPTSVNLNNQPTLVNAIERKAQRALYPDRNREELHDIYTRLNIEHTGPVYFQPMLRGDDVVAVLLLCLPYAQRELNRGEAELLNGFGIMASDLLQLSYEAKEGRLQAEQRTIDAMLEGVTEAASSSTSFDQLELPASTNEELNLARSQINELTRQVMELKLRLDDERTRLANMLDATDETMTVSQRIRAINEEQQRLREERDELRRRLQEAETALSSATTEDNRLVVDRIVDTLKVERDNLTAEREQLQRQLDELRVQQTEAEDADVQQMVNNMIEERSRLEVERNQLKDNLLGIQSQLAELGIEEGTSGLAQLIGQLYEQRADLRERTEKLQRERDALLNERKSYESSINQEKERDERIANLQLQIENVAVDRDTIMRQRDKLRAEHDEIQEKLDTVKDHRARVLAQASGLELELDEAVAEQAKLRDEIQKLANERSDLVSERDRLSAEAKALQTERDQLLAHSEGNRARFQELSEEGVGSLRDMIDDLTNQRSQLERQLADVSSRLVESEKQLSRLKTQSGSLAMTEAFTPEQSEMMVSLAQDLRTPLTSILGYLSLLLQENAGILGERQRNYLERMATGVDRLEIMIDDLVKITALDTGQLKLHIEPVNIVQIVEDVITSTYMQFREKRLALNLDLDDTMAPVLVDREGLRTVIGQLLTNAYLASPPGQEISVVVRQDAYQIRERESLRECVFISVLDQGGGVAPEDIADVFKRRYRATNPLIAGLGDTGVGLAIAKAIVEAHHGRLWVDIQEGVGTRLSIVIPIEGNQMLTDEAGG